MLITALGLRISTTFGHDPNKQCILVYKQNINYIKQHSAFQCKIPTVIILFYFIERYASHNQIQVNSLLMILIKHQVSFFSLSSMKSLSKKF